MIMLHNVCKYFTMGDETLTALDHVDIHVKPKEFVSIIGPSGSGKSTLMNIVGCLDIPDEGQYYLDGIDVLELSDNQLSDIRSKKIGFIFQQFNLLQQMTALENVELPLIYQRVSALERMKRAEQALDMVGLKNRMLHKPNELSGGQQQRVAIARALVSKPSIILADEPTGNLDSKSGDDVMKIIQELSMEGNTIVLITHSNKVADMAQRKICIYDGKVEG